MKYIIRLRDNETGEEISYMEDYAREQSDEAEALLVFIWTEGNYACDCNRGLFFGRAKDGNDMEVECGFTRFTAVDATAEDGTVIPLDAPEK